ncbi:MAG: hypothetical protein ACFCD0_12830 [Gemmataceae bacterium]
MYRWVSKPLFTPERGIDGAGKNYGFYLNAVSYCVQAHGPTQLGLTYEIVPDHQEGLEMSFQPKLRFPRQGSA